MSSKEFRVVGRFMLFSFAIYSSLILFGFVWINFFLGEGNTSKDLVASSWRPFALVLVFLLGNLPFSREKADTSFEYLFTLPMARAALLKKKILPRVVAALFLLGTDAFLGHVFKIEAFIIDSDQFILLFVSIFLFSVSFSLLSRRNEINIIITLVSMVLIGFSIILLFFISAKIQTLFSGERAGAEDLKTALTENQQGLFLIILTFSIISALRFAYLFAKRSDINFLYKIRNSLAKTCLVLLIPTLLFLFFQREYLPGDSWKSHFLEESYFIAPGGVAFIKNGKDVFTIKDGIQRPLDISPVAKQFRVFAHEGTSGWETYIWNGGSLFRYNPQDNFVKSIWRGRPDCDYSFLRVSKKAYFFEHSRKSAQPNSNEQNHSALISFNFETNQPESEAVNFQKRPFFLSLTNVGSNERILSAHFYYYDQLEYQTKRENEWIKSRVAIGKISGQIKAKLGPFSFRGFNPQFIYEPKSFDFFSLKECSYPGKYNSIFPRYLLAFYADEGCTLFVSNHPQSYESSRSHLSIFSKDGKLDFWETGFEFHMILGMKAGKVFFIATKGDNAFLVKKDLRNGSEKYFSLPSLWEKARNSNDTSMELPYFFFINDVPYIINQHGMYRLGIAAFNEVPLKKNVLKEFFGEVQDMEPFGIVFGRSSVDHRSYLGFFDPFYKEEIDFKLRAFMLPSMELIKLSENGI